MKRIISLVLVLASLLTLCVFCFTGCGAINKSEVSILWSGNDKAEIPGSLIDCMERAMYIENISYKHYGATNNADKQLEQAKTVINAGCQILAIELVEGSTHAQEIVDLAKAKSVPVIFFNCDVEETVVNSYNKCVYIKSDVDTVTDIQGLLIADYVKANFKDIDHNADNKITILNYDLDAESMEKVIAKANEILATKDYMVSRAFLGLFDKFNMTVELSDKTFDTAAVTDYEMLLVASDDVAANVLVELQKQDYNTDKLKDQFVPILTVGESFDYKALVISGRPAIPENLVINENDDKKTIENKDKEIKNLDYLQSYYESKKNLVDLTAVNESDLKNMIYTTVNVIDAGRIGGTVTEDRDTIALTVAAVIRNFAKGNDAFKDISSETVVVSGSVVKVKYITYTK